MGNISDSNLWLIEIGENDQYWATCLERVPNMICIAYRHLRTLAKEGKVYGTMLQCKDIFELVCKTPLIMALISLEENQKYKDTEVFQEVLKICLDAPMSMGSWDSLAGILVKKQNDIHLPESIYQILKRTRRLYQEKISNSASNVVHWRNNTIGHGVLRFENDASYSQELTCLLNLLREYFDGQKKYSIRGLYEDLYFLFGENRLTGEYWSDEIKEGNVQLAFEGKRAENTNYIVNQNYKYYLFDAFYKTKRIAKYSSYIDGHSIIATNLYFSELSKRVKMAKAARKDLKSVYIKREEERILEYLNAPVEYVEPEWLVKELEERMEELGQGVITIFMERGTGKSAFANQMNGLYYSNTLIPAAFSRSYHIQNAVVRGISDFVNAINFGYRHSCNSDDDLYGSEEELPVISLHDENPQQSLASFLNTYHQIYEKDYTILFLDGIDELTSDTSDIMKFLPSREMLDEGIFIVLLSRFEDEQTVLGQSKEHIRHAANIADSVIELRRISKFNVEVLKNFIMRNKPDATANQMDDLIARSDYRMLYLKAILAVAENYDFDNTNETGFISSFMEYVSSFYGINQRTKMEEIAVAIALFPDISLNEYKRYIACQEITYEFVGLLNNLLPLMTITHRDGVTCYAFADQAYGEYMIGRYPEVVQSVIERFYVSFAECLDVYLRGSGFQVRDFEKNPNFNSAELNKDIVFFARSLVEIWGKAPRQCMIADMQIPEKNVLRFYANLTWDKWARFGIGAYLRDSLRDSICMSLYMALLMSTKTKDNVSTKWAENIINHIEHREKYSGESDFSPYSLIDHHLKDSEKFDKYLLDYVITHIKDMKDIKQWYWVFVRACSKRVADAIVDSSCTDEFIEYLLASAPQLCYEKWFELLLTYEVSDEIKSRMISELEKFSYDENLGYNYYSEALEDAIVLLEDYATPIKNDKGDADQDNVGPIDKIFVLIGSGFKMAKSLGEENVHRLCVAFINRLNYEREQGTFEEFIYELHYFNGHLLGEIYEQYYGENWPEKAAVIIPDLIGIERGMYNYFATDALVNLMTKLAGWLEQKNRFSEEIDILEKLMDGIDGRYFLIGHPWHPLYPWRIYYDKHMDSSGWERAECWYPTDNALYLLKLLNRHGLYKKMEVWMDAMERSCSFVDETIYKDKELTIVHELQKYRFLQMRKLLDYHSSFDNQVEALVSNHRVYILSELENISDNSAFGQIHYETELLLDHAWQMKQWDLGIEECDRLLNSILKIEEQKNSDMVIQSVGVLKDKIKRCKALFLFMLGMGNNSETEVAKTKLISSYYKPNYTLCWCLRIFEDKDATSSEKMDKILKEIEIKLGN